MAFKPAIPPPKKTVAKQRASKHYIANATLDQEVKKVMEAPDQKVNFYKAFVKQT